MMQVRRPAKDRPCVTTGAREKASANMKSVIVYIACTLLWCESLTASDTLRLPNMEPLVIWGSVSRSAFDRTIASDPTWSWGGWDLGKSLQRLALAQVNSTGAMGASSTIRCRGLASDHTVITWHGMSLNSPTLGTADASLIPLNLFGRCRMMYQPNLMQSSAQGLGATIEVAEQENAALASVHLGFNSLNNSSASFQADLLPHIKRSQGTWYHQWRTGAYLQHWNNDFKYQDPWVLNSPWIQQRHNNGKSAGSIMNWSATRGMHRFSAHGWYVQRDTKLPATMGSELSGTAEQSDRQLRGVAEYVYQGNTNWFRAALRSQDFLQSYNDAGVWNIHSRMHAQSHQLALEGTKQCNDVWQVGAQVQAMQQQAISSNLEGEGTRVFQYATAAGVKRMTDRSHLHVDARADMRWNRIYWSGTLSNTSFFTLGEWQMETRWNAGRRVRLPDLNELFWSPGGNPGLHPEEA
ncbi:MAG: TonB-dependent receptor, partial [Flavobacteriales bacterium]